MTILENRYGKSRVRIARIVRNGDRHEFHEMTVGIQLEGDFESSYSAWRQSSDHRDGHYEEHGLRAGEGSSGGAAGIIRPAAGPPFSGHESTRNAGANRRSRNIPGIVTGTFRLRPAGRIAELRISMQLAGNHGG